MRILIVSSNPLFSEAIHEATAAICSERIELDPFIALDRICEVYPDIIMVDETIEARLLEGILSEARNLPRTRTIVVNPTQNEIILLDSRKARLSKVEDLTEAILTQDPKTQQQNGEFKQNAEEARALAGMFNFLATMFNERPDINLVRRLRTIGIDAFVNLQHAGETEDINQGVLLITKFIEDILLQDEQQVEKELVVDWTRLFRGVGQNYGPPPPYEALYNGGGLDEIRLFQVLNNAYLEAGVELSQDFGNRLDYLGLELAFLGHLAAQEADAWETGDRRSSEKYADRMNSFFKEHPGTWAHKFLTRSLEYAQTDLYKGFILLSRGLIAQSL